MFNQAKKPQAVIVTPIISLEMMSVVKPWTSSTSVAKEVAPSFSSLNDIFGEMIEDQHPLSMNKWETANSATR